MENTETLTQGEIQELMVAWDVDQQVQKEVSHIFAEGCSVKQFHTLFEHYRNAPLEDGGPVTWDIKGMKRDFSGGGGRSKKALMLTECTLEKGGTMVFYENLRASGIYEQQRTGSIPANLIS